ncbi:Vacuolar protein sorting-associated protein 8 [Thoreauomyces humboldtii]|nr:Vacuolar protein sorting-associated protein 8 [Thoreauomyces humboldtii]
MERPPGEGGRQASHKELHMSDLGSIENLFDDIPASSADFLSGSGALSDSEDMASVGLPDHSGPTILPTAPVPGTGSPASWRPFASGFRLPAWGRRMTADAAPLSRSASESRLTVLSAKEASQRIVSEGRPSVARSLTSAPSVREKADDAFSEDSALADMMGRFATLVITGELADADQTLLQSKIAKLHLLQSEVVQHLYAQDLAQRDRATTLLESIVDEIGVYGEFLDTGNPEPQLGMLIRDEGVNELVSIVSPAHVVNDGDSTGLASSAPPPVDHQLPRHLERAMRQKMGTPTVINLAGGILVGTSRSIVLIYDFSQSLRAALGDSSEQPDPGPVTSISLGPGHTHLVCGYAEGLIRVWDVQKRTIVRSVVPLHPMGKANALPNGHQQGAAIVHIAFVGSRGAFVSADDHV